MSRATGTAAALGALALAIGSMGAGCACVSDPPSQAFEFEADCLDGTCGFRAERGAVERATTLVPGEHGIALDPATRASRSLEVPWRGPRVSFVAHCEQPTSVTIEVELETSDAPMSARRVTRTARVTHTVGSEWIEAFETLDPGGAVYDGVLRRVAIETTAGGRCLLDSVYLGVARTQCP